VTNHLRRQQNLIQDMKSACPTYATTRWILMGKVLRWLKDKRMTLLPHFQEKQPACAPPNEWWILVSIVQPLIERIERTFMLLQGSEALVCEQRDHLHRLACDIANRMRIHMDVSEPNLRFLTMQIVEPTYGYTMENCTLKRLDIEDSIHEIDCYVQRSMDELKASDSLEDKASYNLIVTTIASFTLQLVSGTASVPPCLPVDLCNMNPRDFTAALNHQNVHLKHSFTDDQIMAIDQQYCDLCVSFREEEGLAYALENAHDKLSSQSFRQCWTALEGRFPDLVQFCGGITSVMPGTSCVEADFSLINWTKDPNSKAMTDFTLESILHCKQHHRLQKLFES
jgi:hypothetical protein